MVVSNCQHCIIVFISYSKPVQMSFFLRYFGFRLKNKLFCLSYSTDTDEKNNLGRFC